MLSCAAVGVPAFIIRFSGIELDPPIAALLLGIGIVGGAFLLSWAAEVAQFDVSASLAIAVLALIAVLPEYTIEAVLAWDAGSNFDVANPKVTNEMEVVAANVTGANRLLIGLGWSLVILVYWLKRRRALDLRGHLSLEMVMLVVATLGTLVIFFMGQLHMFLAFALIGLYAFYLWRSSSEASEEPELMGPALMIGSYAPAKRRALVAVLLVYSAAVILVAAEPFVDGLVETGEKLGIDEFLLIQWVAPLASESPEIIVALLFSLRANPTAGITTLISSQVNQLTLLIGSMVVVFSISAGELLSFPLNDRQSVEFFLTAMVSVFAILLIAPRLVSWRAGFALLVLFVAHLFFVDEGERLIFAFIYLGLSGGLVAIDRRRVRQAIMGA